MSSKKKGAHEPGGRQYEKNKSLHKRRGGPRPPAAAAKPEDVKVRRAQALLPTILTRAHL